MNECGRKNLLVSRNTAANKIGVEATSLLWQLQWRYNTDNKMYLNLYNCGSHFSGKSLLMATKFNLGVNAPKNPIEPPSVTQTLDPN